MRVFTCNNFKGYWPVGSAAVVVAEDRATAYELLIRRLKEIGLADQPSPPTLVELDLTRPAAVVLHDGNY